MPAFAAAVRKGNLGPPEEEAEEGDSRNEKDRQHDGDDDERSGEGVR